MSQDKSSSAHERALSWYCRDSDVPKILERLRSLHGELVDNPTEYSDKMPALLSHVDAYANDLEKLQRYAGDVVARRMHMLAAAQLIKTRFFLDMYLTGFERKNPYSLFMGSRAQIESHAVLWDAFRIVRVNAGDHAEEFVPRVRACDDALLKAYFGTRTLLEFIKKIPGKSKVRDFRPEDEGVFAADNVLNRIDRLSKSDDFKYCREIYERICEYLHPNMAQNIILAGISSRRGGVETIAADHPDTMQRALHITARPMLAAAGGSRKVVADSKPPFSFCGTNVRVTFMPFPAARLQRAGRNDPCFCGSGRKFKKCHGA